jgi:hypothetical protein
MRKILPAVVLSAFALSGCWSRPAVDEEPKSKTRSETPVAGKSAAGPKTVQRTSMEGTWVVQMSYELFPQGPFGWIPVCLLNISQQSGKLIPEMTAVVPRLKGLRIKSADIGEQSAHLVLEHQRYRLDVLVTLDKTAALGNVVLVSAEKLLSVPARLLATNEKRLEAFRPAPHEHHIDLKQAMESFMKQQSAEGLDAFIKKYPRSPLACYAVYARNPIVAVHSLSDPRPAAHDIREHVKRVEALEAVWGRRTVVLAKLELAQHLIRWIDPSTHLRRDDTNLEIASELIRDIGSPESETLLNDTQKRRLAGLKESLRHEQNVVAVLDAKDPQQRSEAMARVDRYFEAGPTYLPWALYALAEGNRNAGNVDKSLEQFARLLVMPGATFTLKHELEARWRKTPDLRKRLEELWAKKDRGKAVLDDYLAREYRKLMRDMLPNLVATRPPKYRTRTHLCELFTSCDDPASVGADVATQIVQRTHKSADVVVLRYHLDHPRPNPLVSNDSILRAFDCRIATPPMVLVNGKPLAVYANGQRFIPDLRRTLAGMPLVRDLVRDAVYRDSTGEPPRYQIHVSAAARAGKLRINAEVDGPMKADPDLRLRIVLAEDRIAYQGENGIRYHDMVVRSMPGGIDGVSLSAGKTTFEKTIDLADLSGRLRDFLTSLEEKSTKKLKLSVKPVNFKKLHVVVFVQSVKRRREVLQVAQAVVAGLDSATASVPQKGATKP